MAIPSRQIGWGTEDNLLWQISKQLERLTCVTAGGCGSITTTTTSSTTAAPVYKVFTALLTQSGGDNPYIIYGDAGTILVGITYQILANPNNFDFTPYGAPNSEVGTYFVCTQQLALDENPDSVPTQLSGNEGAPVVTVLENTIGNIWFTYDNTGIYTIKSNSLFTTNKTTFFMGIMDINPGQPIVGTDHFANDESTYQIVITDQSGNTQNEFLYNTPIEIRVYN